MQATLQSYHQLQKDNEELKETAAVAETSGFILKLKVQQLEKQAHVYKQQLLDHENQVLQ
jgi:hypothetical protein